jgi:hypothetical protein
MRIDWAARAAIVLENLPPKVTDKTDETRQPDTSGRLSSVSSVPSGQTFSKSHDSGGANQWRLYYANERTREVTFSPYRTEAEVRTDCPDCAALIEAGSTIASCRLCGHASRYGSCGIPVEAGLADHFALMKHPDGGTDCRHFAPID